MQATHRLLTPALHRPLTLRPTHVCVCTFKPLARHLDCRSAAMPPTRTRPVQAPDSHLLRGLQRSAEVAHRPIRALQGLLLASAIGSLPACLLDDATGGTGALGLPAACLLGALGLTAFDVLRFLMDPIGCKWSAAQYIDEGVALWPTDPIHAQWNLDRALLEDKDCGPMMDRALSAIARAERHAKRQNLPGRE